MNLQVTKNMDDTHPRESFLLKSPSLIIFLIAFTVFASEAIVMLLLYFLQIESSLIEGLVDSTLLVLLTSPALFLFVFRPIVIHMRNRMQIEDVLLENKEEQFKAMIRASLDGFWMTDIHGRFLEVNDSFCRLMGYSREELLSLGVSDVEAIETTDDAAQHISELIEKGNARFETCYRHKDGNILNVEISSNYSKIGGERIYCFLRDITERQQAEEALRYSEERFRDVSNAAGEYLWEVDVKSMVYTYVSNRSGDVKGYAPKELLGRTPMEFMPEEDIQLVGEIVNAAIANKAPFKLQHRDITKSGAVLWEEVNGIPFYDKNGTMIGLRGTGLNITERKQAEVELRIAAASFETQESIMITDANSVILRINQSFTESTGYTSDDAVGQTPKLLKSGRHNADFYREMWAAIQSTGSWQGEIWDRRKNGEVYPKMLTITAVKGGDGAVIHYVGSHIDITERKAAEEKIQYLAFYDPLTSLPNRRLLMDRLHQSLASSQRLGREGALLFLDLDNFKVLNDTLGHDIGDLMLQQVAQRLKSCVRDDDTVARLGGDEFVVVLEALSKDALVAASQTEAIGAKIRNSLNQPYKISKLEHHSSASIGAVMFGNHQTLMEELMKQADIAMYQAKKAGRNTLRFFDPRMQEIVNDHAALENDLRNALVQRQFQLYYQIQTDNLHHSLGAEALIRWIHPERGFVSPAQFIPLAEETWLILPIGLWVLETACAQIKAWEQNALTSHLVLAVNVSSKQFRQSEFIAQVKATVQHYDIKPNLLKLELTESLLLEDIEDTIATMNALKEVGIQFSLDDFGTGYSSLQYLKRLPLDQLKIDQSFVRDITVDSNDKAIVKTIIAMAHSMDMDVIAEGVETEEQRQLLFDEGCMHYQGYLFAKPVPIAQFEALLKKD